MPSRTEPARASSSPAATCTAFGLRLTVDPRIAIPGLPASPGPGASARAIGEARISLDPEELARRWGPVGADATRMRELREGGAVVLTVDLAEPAGYLLQAAGIGKVLVSPDGEGLLCDPLPERDDWATIFPAQALPLAATLQGLEVLHAAGIGIDGEAWLLSGPPGAGKSSLAAALLRRGGSSLGDDAIALEATGDGLLAHPGSSAVFLRDGENDRLTTEERGLVGVAERSGGRWRYESKVASGPLPFGALFLLERADSGPMVERWEGVDPTDLLAATFNLSVRTPARLTRQLDLVGALASSGRVFRLRVLPGVDATRLAEVVAEQVPGG